MPGDALASQPRAAPGAAGGGAGGGGGGRVGRARASPTPEPSLGLASHVNLDRLISCRLRYCEHGGVLVIADGGNPAVVGLEVEILVNCEVCTGLHWFSRVNVFAILR